MVKYLKKSKKSNNIYYSNKIGLHDKRHSIFRPIWGIVDLVIVHFNYL